MPVCLCLCPYRSVSGPDSVSQSLSLALPLSLSSGELGAVLGQLDLGLFFRALARLVRPPRRRVLPHRGKGSGFRV